MFKSTSIADCSVESTLKTELTYLEKLNSCEQVYYTEDESMLVQYKQKVDIFNFMPRLSCHIKLNIIGKPYSISEKGYCGDPHKIDEIIRNIKGLKIILNGDDDLTLPKALTLSSHVFHNRFKSFEHYLMSLRSHYRYRVKKALRKSSDIMMTKMEQKHFDETHYQLYLEVYENSHGKLECLSLAFFREFPSELYEFRIGETNELIGFTQLVQQSGKLTFLFGGFKQCYIRSYDIYMKMLIEIIRIGINRGIEMIEFGQTAEETKLKLGCVAVKKYLYVHHSNRMFHFIVAKILPRLSYKPHTITYNVFKDEQ